MNNIEKPIGLSDLEALSIDLLKISTYKRAPFSVEILNNLIMKVDIIIRKLKHNPRLPFFEIEKDIIEICKRDPSTHGVVVRILFVKKYVEIDSSRLSCLTVNV